MAENSMPSRGSLHSEAPQATQRKGPRRAIISSSRFLPGDQRSAIYQAFLRGERIETLASRTRIQRGVVQELIRDQRDAEVGRLRNTIRILTDGRAA